MNELMVWLDHLLADSDECIEDKLNLGRELKMTITSTAYLANFFCADF